MPKTTKAYCIEAPDKEIILSTLRLHLRECIDDFINSTTPPQNWERLKKIGWKVAKMKIMKVK